jgi:cytochrome P450
VDTLEHHERMITMVMVKVLFGADGEKGDELTDAIMAAIDANHHIPLAPTPIPGRIPFPGKRRFARALAELHRLIEEAAAASAASGEPATDVLSLLRGAADANGNGMSAEQARDEALALYRGQNTVAASSLSWTWYLLSRHPEAERRFHDEIDSVLGGRAPTYDDFSRLPFVLMVYREALRLYPPAWTILRRAIAPHQAREYEIPAGARW